MKVLDLYGVREVPVNPHVRSDGQDAPSVERPRARHRDSAHPWCRVRPSGRCPGHRGKVSAQSKVIEASPRSAMRLQKCRIRAIVSPSPGSFFFRTALWREGARDPGCRPDLSPRPWMMAATPAHLWSADGADREQSVRALVAYRACVRARGMTC